MDPLLEGPVADFRPARNSNRGAPGQLVNPTAPANYGGMIKKIFCRGQRNNSLQTELEGLREEKNALINGVSACGCKVLPLSRDARIIK